MTPADASLSMDVFGYAARRALLVLHAGSSVVLIGAATHHALQMRYYLRGQFKFARLEKTYAKVVAAGYLLTMALGALLYPTYRVNVRALFLERDEPFLARLFDVKEVYASLALPLAVALGALAFTLRPSEERRLVPVYAAMSLVVCAVVWLNVIVGLWITSARGIG